MSDASPPAISIMNTVFPVVAMRGSDQQNSEVARPDAFGTAFAIAPDIFVTAAHVVRSALTCGELAVAGPRGEPHEGLGAARVRAHEVWDDLDVALLFTAPLDVTPLDFWLTNRLQVLTDVASFAYPHAVTKSLDGSRYDVVFRAYKGYVITTRSFWRLPSQPPVYEISCAFPEGASGAPVLLNDGERLIVVGVVLGIDTVEYGGVAQNVGIAMTSEMLLDRHVAKLGKQLRQCVNLATITVGPPPDSAHE